MSATVNRVSLLPTKNFVEALFLYPLCIFFFALYLVGIGAYFVKIWTFKKLGIQQKPESVETPGLVMKSFVYFWNEAIGPSSKSWLSSQAKNLYEKPFTRHFIGLYAYGNYAEENYTERYLPYEFKERFECFQDFFARELREKPIFEKDEAVIGCEGLLCDKHLVAEEKTVSIKGDLLRNRDVFGSYASEIPGDYEFINIFLNNRDYHHIHSPVEARIEAIERIPGDLIVLRPWFYKNSPSLPAILNERVNMKLIDHSGRPCYLSIVGGPVVNSVILPDGLSVGSYAQAGQKIASFHLGSTFCLASPYRLSKKLNSRVELFDRLEKVKPDVQSFNIAEDSLGAIEEAHLSA